MVGLQHIKQNIITRSSTMTERNKPLHYLTPNNLVSYTDLTHLPCLYDETVLECTIARYNEDFIYTWAGPILVAVNPFRKLNFLFTLDNIKNVFIKIKQGVDDQDPHVYTVAGLAHHRLVFQIGQVNQAILVSGESGAGKTESARYLLTFLTCVASQNILVSIEKQPEDVQQCILASNPVLEAFGNALTLRNNNSSRFGKLIRLQYDGYNLKGAKIDTYLLEKTRVTTQPTNERNFHIFYQVLAAINNKIFEWIDDVDVSSFVITPGYRQYDDEIDLSSFHETNNALCALGVSCEKRTFIYQIIVALLYLGNVSFQYDGTKEIWVISKSEKCRYSIEVASRLLGLDSDSLIEALIVRKIAVNTSSKTTVFNKWCERREQCQERHHALMQLIYASLFTDLVAAINENISAPANQWNSYLGILDVYGFESFSKNSLEQLCINYTNERLQQEFSRRYLASEMRILIEEGFMDCPLVYTDNAKCVSALDSSVSVFSILNEECQLRHVANEEETCQRVCRALEKSGVVLHPSSICENSGFVIKHYAGYVTYSSSGILHKNKDYVPKELVELLGESKNKFVRDLKFGVEDELPTTSDTPTRRGVRKITTLSKFKSSLDSLMKILTACDLHYVRCLKPNMNNIPKHIDEPFLLNQLGNNGILETVKISQAGYPVRMLYHEFRQRYKFSKCNKPYYDSKETSLLIACNILGDDGTGSPVVQKCRFGRTRIFLSESSLHKLEDWRTRCRTEAAVCIQKYIRRFMVIKIYKDTLSKIVLLQNHFKGLLNRLHFLKKRNACIAIQKNIRSWLIAKKYRKMKEAVIVLQKYIRGWICKNRFAKLKRFYIEESLRTSSRVSLTSLGYESLATTAGQYLTDHSVSDLEPLVSTEENDKRARFLDTEESGVETDTESLSGQGLKDGRRTKVKSRKEFSKLSSVNRSKNSDEDEENIHFFNRISSKGRKLYNKPTLPSGLSSKNIHLQLKNKFIRIKEKDVSKQQLHTPTTNLKQFRKAMDIQRKFTSLKSLQLRTMDLSLFFRDGVLSYRQIPKVKIKFYNRNNCLPYATQVPFSERPQGLIDAVR